MAVTHFRLLVDKFVDVFEFYRETIGLPTTYKPGSSGPYAEFELGGDRYLGLFDRSIQFEAIGRTKPAPVEPDDRLIICVEVPDADVEEQRLRGLGLDIVAPATNHPEWGLRTTYVRDPEGNLVEFYSAVKESS